MATRSHPRGPSIKATKKVAASLPSTFGNGIPVQATPEAEQFFAKLPEKAMTRVFTALDEWLTTRPPQRVMIEVEVEPEDPDWQELVVGLIFRCHDEECLDLWDELGATLDKTFATLSPRDVRRLNEGLSVQIVPADSEPDD
jgi:hypothetical protein